MSDRKRTKGIPPEFDVAIGGQDGARLGYCGRTHLQPRTSAQAGKSMIATMINVAQILEIMAEHQSKALSVPTQLRCSENCYAALRASIELKDRFIFNEKKSDLSFLGLKISIDPELKGMEWKVLDKHGIILQKSPADALDRQYISFMRHVDNALARAFIVKRGR
jgi:hypothetical protein